MGRLLVLLLVGLASGWRDSRPRMVVDYLKQHADDVQTFLGNQTHSDHFKLLRQDGSSLLIGARNVVYNISLNGLQENHQQRITWNSRHRDTELCLVKGKSEDDCNNYIRVLAKQSNDALLVCGTNSYNPRCRSYKKNREDVFEVVREYSGKGYCPFDPRHNSTSLFTGGKLYSGTVSDFSGSDALIIKDQVRTEQYNLKHLNGPDFVASIEDKDHVYFFFREEAVEYMNCGKDVYSRVGRVCKNDEGGPHTFRNKWTTFLKTRLNCSVPGSYPFYFDQIQSMSQLIRTKNEDVVFGVFNTPENSITGSAVCSFKMSDIRDSFNGPFKAQSDVNSNWLPLAKHQVPATRPGSCHNNSRSLGEEHLNFLKENTLMDQAVPSSINIPHFIKTSPHERLTTIAVDPAVPTSQGETADVLFVGTTRGRVLKMASYQYEGVPKTTLIEELQVFPLHVSVSNILIVRSGAEPRVVVLSKHEVKSLPVARCHSTNIQSCGECVAMQDPYCAWNVKIQRCQSLQGSSEDRSSLLQNIGEGHHSGCPAVSLTNSERSHVENGGRVVTNEQSSKKISSISGGDGYFQDIFPRHLPVDRPFRTHQENVYSEKTLTFACTSAGLVALLIGFLTGYLFSRKCQKKEPYLKCGHAYLEARGPKWSAKDKGGFLDSGYNSTASTTKNNLLRNVPVKSDIQKNNLAITKNGVLGKCKKIYL